MKRFIMAMMSMVMLAGCANPYTSKSQIGSVGRESIRQENLILFSDLEKGFQDNNMKLIKVTPLDAPEEQYNFEDDRVTITVMVDALTFQDEQFVSDIFIDPLNNYMKLAEHPAVKIMADMMGEEQLLAWVADRENGRTQAGKNHKNIQELLAMDRCYLFYEYWSGSDRRGLGFSWAFKPSISTAFEKIARQLEEDGMLTTGYIQGAGGETLTATNSGYYLLQRMAHSVGEDIAVDIDQAAAYQVMHDKNKPGNYSVQLYGYMRSDLTYPAHVEDMPGLDEITQLMNMGQEEFTAITDEINKELTEAKKIRNNNLRGEYYFQGEVGGYRYIITVPQGIAVYNFTVLIEKI
ncbi:MAG TPA: hypothetical protein GX707_11305 [Epulopiscium sp.]|nr:hypothetical protein [Candidatus Epulonipiscium sp.]